MSAFHIRFARAAELGQLSLIEQQAEQRFPPERLVNTHWVGVEQFRAALQQDLLWVAECDGQAVGFCLAEPWDADLHVVEIDVLPLYGRRGIGRALMQAVIDNASEKSYRRVTLTTFGDMPWNRPFYQRLGFHVIKPGGDEVRLTALLAKEKARGAVQRVAMALAL